MSEHKKQNEKSQGTPFSIATLNDLHDLGLEAEDIEVISHCRGTIQKQVLSLLSQESFE